MKPHVILNPASAGGKTGEEQLRVMKALERSLGKNYSLCVTGRPLEATSSTRDAIRNGCELIVAVGGDGTIQEVVNGFFSEGQLLNPCCQLAIICSGTGRGFAQSLGLPTKLDDQFEIVTDGEARSVDVGKVSFHLADGKMGERFFVNECQVGIGGVVVKGVGTNHKRLGGLAGFGLVTLSTALHHRAQTLVVVIDNRLQIERPLLGVIIANGAYAGGGMCLAPHARVDDGLLDLVMIHDQSLIQRLKNFSRIYSGRHVESPLFNYHQGKRFKISSPEPALLEADGELLGSLPCTVEILPRALKIISRK